MTIIIIVYVIYIGIAHGIQINKHTNLVCVYFGCVDAPLFSQYIILMEQFACSSLVILASIYIYSYIACASNIYELANDGHPNDYYRGKLIFNCCFYFLSVSTSLFYLYSFRIHTHIITHSHIRMKWLLARFKAICHAARVCVSWDAANFGIVVFLFFFCTRTRMLLLFFNQKT